MDASSQERLEDLRQLEHLAPVGFAFLLPYLPYWAVLSLAGLAVVHAVYLSPRLFGTTRSGEERLSRGKLIYAGGVIVLVVVFHDRLYLAAAVWGILAAGDSFSNLAGRRWGRVPLPYNSSKSWAGLLAFILSGTAFAATLLVWNDASHQTGLSLWALTMVAFLAALICGLAESLPPILDDNLIIVWVGGMLFPVLLQAAQAAPRLREDWGPILGLNLLAAALARGFGWLSWRGTLAALLFGLAIMASLGWPGYLVISSFLVLASLATRIGLSRKRDLAVAQANQGQRGISNVLANGGVALVLALLAFWLGAELWLRVAYTAAVATAAFDTVSTEIGQWLGRVARNPINLRAVPVGTAGAVSVPGTGAGWLAASLVSLVAFSTGWLPPELCLVSTAGAFAGAFLESVMASLFRYNFPWADEVLNLYSTMAGAFLAVMLSNWLVGG